MRFLPFAARLCARQSIPRAPIRSVANIGRWHSTHTLPRKIVRNSGRTSRPNGRVILKATASGALLGTAAFIKLSEKSNDGTEQTAEGRMLQASREELEKTVDEDKRGLSRFAQQVIIFLDVYIWEPICTGVRFCQLVVIFVPVILSVPAIWIGRRQPDHDNERSGTLWWYNFLVWAMEAAGPAFIKVRGLFYLTFLPLRWLS
jgi:aarF domain-containing kinase